MVVVLLVGPESPFLRILSAVLSRAWSVYAACDEASLQEFLSATTQPSIVVFDHTQPTDLFELNPRRFGFSGPIVLLADEPTTARQLLVTDISLRRPSDLVELHRLITELAEDSNEE